MSLDPISGVLIPVVTDLTVDSGSFSYKTEYQDMPLLEVWIADTVYLEGGVSFKEGEGGARYNEFITCYVENGDLIVDGENTSNYSIDSNGELIYTY